MTPKFRYSLYSQNEVAGVNRAVAAMALQQSVRLLRIPLPGLLWFRPTKSGEEAKVEISYSLSGFTPVHGSDWNVYVLGSLGAREVYKTVCHEAFHLARAKPGTGKGGPIEEAETEAFAERTTQTYFDQRRAIY